MIQEILEAFCGEMQELFTGDNDVTVLRDTQFDTEETPSHTLPLVILGLADSPDMRQLSGGCTQAEWNWAIRVYFIDSNAELSPDQAFSTGSYSIIEKIVNHLNFQVFLTQAFRDVLTNYSFKLTYEDTSKAAPLLKDDGGMIPGFQIIYSSIGVDTSTSFTVYSASTLQKVREVPMGRVLAVSVIPSTLTFIKAGEAKTVAITANTPWCVKSIPPWCGVSLYEGNDSQTLTVTAAANATILTRTGSVVLAAPLSGLADVIIAVSQAGV